MYNYVWVWRVKFVIIQFKLDLEAYLEKKRKKTIEHLKALRRNFNNNVHLLFSGANVLKNLADFFWNSCIYFVTA